MWNKYYSLSSKFINRSGDGEGEKYDQIGYELLCDVSADNYQEKLTCCQNIPVSTEAQCVYGAGMSTKWCNQMAMSQIPN